MTLTETIALLGLLGSAIFGTFMVTWNIAKPASHSFQVFSFPVPGIPQSGIPALARFCGVSPANPKVFHSFLFCRHEFSTFQQ